jgi:cbb3-type cytochrome oxidase cytochrome c subunit
MTIRSSGVQKNWPWLAPRGQKYPDSWHYNHMLEPEVCRQRVPIMPIARELKFPVVTQQRTYGRKNKGTTVVERSLRALKTKP